MGSRISSSLTRGALRLGTVLALVALSLLAAWCASSDPGPGVSGSGSENPPETAPPDTGDEAVALQFTAPRLGGGEVRGGDYAGRDVALWFWAPY